MMVLACQIGWDATGGGTLAAVTGGPSMNIPGTAGTDSILVGYSLTGISVTGCTLTCAADTRWPTAGFHLRPTSNGAAATPCESIHWFDNPMRGRAGEAISMAGTSGANDMWCILYWDVTPYNYKKPTDDLKGPVFKWARTTAASGTNLTAQVVQAGLVTLTQFGAYEYQIDDIEIGGAFTTSPIIGLKVDRADWPYPVYVQLPETNVAALWKPVKLPSGMFKVTKGETLNVSWLSDTTEQPTATINFKYADQGK